MSSQSSKQIRYFKVELEVCSNNSNLYRLLYLEYSNMRCVFLGAMLDVGAGDGSVTEQIAPLVDEVYTTEVSTPMVSVLNGRGYKYYTFKHGY